MSRRQNERASRFLADIEQQMRSAATTFRDNDIETSTAVAMRLWWTSRLRGRRFAQLLRQARDVTQARISTGAIELGEPGRRQAMPYFLAVLRALVNQDLGTLSTAPVSASVAQRGGMGRSAPFPRSPLPQRLRAPDPQISNDQKRQV